jgi:hypothetical protein
MNSFFYPIVTTINIFFGAVLFGLFFQAAGMIKELFIVVVINAIIIIYYNRKNSSFPNGFFLLCNIIVPMLCGVFMMSLYGDFLFWF